MQTEQPFGSRELSLTLHSRSRMQQRGITARMVRIALEIGERQPSHEAVCHRITERRLLHTRFAAESDRLRGLCVVVSRDGRIVTVKWDYRLRQPGPLRRANAENWRQLHSRRSMPPHQAPAVALAPAA